MNAALVLAIVAAAAADPQLELDRLRLEQEVPGVSAVITSGDRLVFAGASGLADIESNRAMTADTVLYAGSLTKVFTAVLTLELVEEDALTLDRAVDGIAIGLPAPAINVFHLLSHAAGLDREGGFDYWFTADFPDTAALSDSLRNADLRAPPGSSLHYSNLGYAALGLVIERASGLPYGEALSSRVLRPLGMTSSGAPGPAQGLATGYTPVGRVLPGESRPFAGLGRTVGERRVREYHDARAMSPAFGAYTSAHDLGRLTRFLLGYGGNEVLSRDMRRRMRSRQPSGWGLGLRLESGNGERLARHDGWFAAHRSHLLLDAENGIGVAVLANSDGASPSRIAYALYRGARDRQTPEPAAPAAERAQ
jgi:CubicO group peptidase (beta-lactamase class C family)